MGNEADTSVGRDPKERGGAVSDRPLRGPWQGLLTGVEAQFWNGGLVRGATHGGV